MSVMLVQVLSTVFVQQTKATEVNFVEWSSGGAIAAVRNLLLIGSIALCKPSPSTILLLKALCLGWKIKTIRAVYARVAHAAAATPDTGDHAPRCPVQPDRRPL